MTELTRCRRCPGFLQRLSPRCPHCGAAASRLGRRVRALLAIAGSGSMALTLMACYGSPCATGDDCIGPPVGPDLSVQLDMSTRDLATRDLAENDDGGSHD
jgi:hypothetical protein